MAKRKRIRSKMPAVVTYCIAVFALVAGLIFPFGKLNSFELGAIPLMQLTGALVAIHVLSALPFGSPISDAFSFKVSTYGVSVDVGAILLLLYALMTALALVLLVPVFVTRRRSQAARRVAAVAELLALVVLTIMFVIDQSRNVQWNLNIFIPLSVTLLMLILQSVIYFGGSGLIKTIMLVLSGIAVIFAICNVADNIPHVTKPLNDLIAALKGPSPFETTAGLYALDGRVYYGSSIIFRLMSNPSALIVEGNVAITIVNFIALALSMVVCINMFFDLLGLGKRTKKFMLITNIIRYLTEFVLLVALMISVFILSGNFGVFSYVLFVIVVIQLFISLIRLLAYKRKDIRVSKAVEEHDEDADIADSDDEYAFEPLRTPSTSASAVASAPATGSRATDDDRSSAYRGGSYYSGPTDSFIRKLTSDEKIEFAKIFLERRVGNLSGIPDYTVGGDNTRFFSAVFIYFARVRDLVSDGLMNKLYEEVNLLN